MKQDKKLKREIAKIQATLEAILRSMNKSAYHEEIEMDEGDDPYFKAILVKRKKYPWD